MAIDSSARTLRSARAPADATGANAGADYCTIRRELAAYGEGLEDKAEIVALSKVDAVDEETLKTQTERLGDRSYGPPVADGGKRSTFLLSPSRNAA